MIWRIAQILLVAAYVAAPVVVLALGVFKGGTPGRGRAVLSFLITCIGAIVVGSVFLLLNRQLAGGRVGVWEGLRLIYLALAALCLLKLADRVLLRMMLNLARVKMDGHGRPVVGTRWRAAGVLIGQRAVMLVLGIAYVTALVMTYRPRVEYEGDALARHRVQGVAAQFQTQDGLMLSGWWIPAADSGRGLEAELAGEWGKDTVLLCHGVGSRKEDLLPLARYLSEHGFNVIAFDFRGHGQSGGNLISYGDQERLDVLAAARWARANHPDQARRILGIGLNTGAAALIGAAADEQAGQAIDGIVLYQPFGRLEGVIEAVTRDSLPGPVAWLIENLSLPLASAHAGTDLAGFAPAEAVGRVWPRPVMVVHGQGLSFVPVWEEMDLFREVSYPREQFWPGPAYVASRERLKRAKSERELLTEVFRQWIGRSNSLSDDAGVREATLRFLREAEANPVI